MTSWLKALGLLSLAAVLSACTGETESSSSHNAMTSSLQSNTSMASMPNAISSSVNHSSSAPATMQPVDQCNTTNQCRITYGAQATDCRDSGADNSVCICGDAPCVATSSSPTTTTSSVNASSSSANTLTGAFLYLDLCSGCHGLDGQDKIFPLNNDMLSANQMVNAITATMPPTAIDDCLQACAEKITDHIKNDLLAGGIKLEPRRPLVARLTTPQILNSVYDIFSVSPGAEVVASMPVESIDEKGFITLADNQRMEAQYPRAYNLLAQDIIAQLNISNFAQQLASCNDTGNACATKFPKVLGLHLFRRPLSDTEQNHYSTLLSDVAALDGANFNDAAGAVIAAMLQAPQFIYRPEQETGAEGGTRELNGYELASRLAYFLWQSTPDAPLLAFAQSLQNQPLKTAMLKSQINRMMQDSRFARTRTTFWADYTITSTASLLNADTQLASDLKTSLMATLERASGVGANPIALQQLFTTQTMMLTERLALDLGLPSKGEGLKLYNTSTAPQRTGFLSHPGLLANIGSTSFVGRGVVMTERILCRHIPEPPSGIQAAIDDTATATKNLTPRQAKDYRFGLGGVCASCHRNFEPIAFAFERFDVLGRYTEQDSQGRDLFSHGYLQTENGDEGTAYDDVAGLMSLLAQNEETSSCFAQNMLTFATGRSHAATDINTINEAHANYLADGGTFNALIQAIALHPAFHQTTTVAN